MSHARLACLLLILAPAGALALHTGVRAPLPAAIRRAALRLAADEAVGKEEDTEAADAGFNWPLLVAATGTALGTGIHWPAFTQFVSQWQDIANSGVTGDDFTAPLQFWVRPSYSVPAAASQLAAAPAPASRRVRAVLSRPVLTCVASASSGLAWLLRRTDHVPLSLAALPRSARVRLALALSTLTLTLTLTRSSSLRCTRCSSPPSGSERCGTR